MAHFGPESLAHFEPDSVAHFGRNTQHNRLYDLSINIFQINSMKTNKMELDVDIIGDQKGLTANEEKALSEFFKERKSASTSTTSKRNKKTQTSTIRSQVRT